MGAGKRERTSGTEYDPERKEFLNQKSKYLLLTVGIVAVVGLVVARAVFLLGRNENESDELLGISNPTETTEIASDWRADGPNEPFEPYGNIVDPVALEWESTARDLTRPGAYRNGEPVSWEYDDGRSIIAGIEATGLTDALYLDLRCSESADGNEIGYYITASTGNLQYSRGFVGEHDAKENSAFTDFAIADRLYTRVRAIRFSDERDYGVRWTDEYHGAESGGGSTLFVRAVNLTSGALICVCDIEICYDVQEDVYYLFGIHSADVSQTGELDPVQRSELVEKALLFAEDKLEITLNDTDWSNLGIEDDHFDWKAVTMAGAVVDKVSRPYFNKFLSFSGKTATYLNDFPDCRNTFAVTVSLPLYGCVTVYFAPWNELHRLPAEYTGTSELQRLEPYAYDPLLPRSEKTLIVPHDGEWDKYIPDY